MRSAARAITYFITLGWFTALMKPDACGSRAAELGGDAPVYKDVWIGQRKDVKPGSGKPSDPFNAGTSEKFDALMSAQRENEHIHILPGIYETRGDAGWQPKDHQWIQGSGMGKTVLRRVGVTGLEKSGQPAVIGGGDGSQQNHVRISDLTLDCNGMAIPPGSISRALSLSCVYAKINNVEAKNFGHYETGAELFGFGVVSNVPGRHWVEIRNCYLHDYISHFDRCIIKPGQPITVTVRGNVVDQYPDKARVVFSNMYGGSTATTTPVSAKVHSVRHDGGVTSFSVSQALLPNCTGGTVSPVRDATLIFAEGTAGATWHGVISENYIYMPNQVPAGFGDAGWDGVLVENNTVYAGSLFNFDTYDSNNACFRNNVVHTGAPAGAYCCVVGGGYHWTNWSIVDNQFYLHPVMNQGIVIKDNVANVEINGNWFFVEKDSTGLDDVPILNLRGLNVVVKSNHFDPRLPNRFQGTPSVALDNTYFDGSLVRSMPGNVKSQSRAP